MTAHPPATEGRPDLLRFAAFASDPSGGNPAGVVLDATGLTPSQMQRIAAAVGYSETAFLLPGEDARRPAIRYFSPRAEVPFCGHATIAIAVAFADRFGPGDLRLATAVGEVLVRTSGEPGSLRATLTSVAPSVVDIDPHVLAVLLTALRLSAADLDPALPVRTAHAGASHPVIAVASRARLARLDYDFPVLGALMAEQGWTTVAVVHRESQTLFHARNPFPPGGIVEDPATGAAAAALGGYLRSLRLVDPPAQLIVRQGAEIGRPSTLEVMVPEAGGIEVSGQAWPIEAPDSGRSASTIDVDAPNVAGRRRLRGSSG